MNVDLGLQKIVSLELDKRNFLLKLFDANELLDKVKNKNMLLLDKVKILNLNYLLLESKQIGFLIPNLNTYWVFRSLP